MKDDEAWRRALEVQARAAALGFDWPDARGVCDKLIEEAGEVSAALEEGEIRRFEEWGDVLFTVVNLGRHLGLDAEAALTAATTRFEQRFAHVEAGLERLPPLGDPARLEAMEALWREAKRQSVSEGDGAAADA